MGPEPSFAKRLRRASCFAIYATTNPAKPGGAKQDGAVGED